MYKEFQLKKYLKFTDDYFYNMNIIPQDSYSININCGYLINLKTLNNLKIKISIKIGCINFIKENKKHLMFCDIFLQK
jgi:hypothetical protein